ncbi:MAG: hypothetical protein NTU53_08305, partial [Planctomycetota bacterium]|nr:hypothetical protein [Planctomycetota bacterium]
QGKSRSAQNALKHGLTAQTPALLPTENESAYLTFRDELLTDLRPRSPLQRTLAERIVQLAWRLRRLTPAETEIFHQKQAQHEAQQFKQHDSALAAYRNRSKTYRRAHAPPEPTPIEPISAPQILANHFHHCEDSYNPFVRLHRYEASLERTFAGRPDSRPAPTSSPTQERSNSVPRFIRSALASARVAAARS